MKTIKIKLAFSPQTNITDRKNKLIIWASAMLHSNRINILEEEHFENLSYIIVENIKS